MHGFSALGLINLKSQCWAGSSSGWGSEEKSISKLILVVAVAGLRSLFHCVPLRRTILTSYSPPSSPSHVTPWSVYRKWKWSPVRLFATPWTVAYQVPPSMGFCRQECWSGLPYPSPGDLPDPGIEPWSPALLADALPSEPPGKPKLFNKVLFNLDLWWVLTMRFRLYFSGWNVIQVIYKISFLGYHI